METYSTMKVNNLTVETLNPTHLIATIYNNKMPDYVRNNLIVKINKYYEKNKNPLHRFKMNI